jgi:hypothetical protein
MSETHKLTAAEWELAFQKLEEMDQLLKQCGILNKWNETDAWTGEPMVGRQFTKEFLTFAWAVKKKLTFKSKPWTELSANEKDAWIWLSVIGWLHYKHLEIPMETEILMSQCLCMFLEMIWVDAHVEPEKRDAVWVERCSKYFWWQSYGMPKTLEEAET